MEEKNFVQEITKIITNPNVKREELAIEVEKLGNQIIDYPSNPVFYFYRGIVKELLYPTIGQLPPETSMDFLTSINLYMNLKNNKKHELRAKTNICIGLDHLREGQKLKEALINFPDSNGDNNYNLWFSLGTLCHKVGLYEKAIYYLDKALNIKESDTQALLKKAYCLEGLTKLNDAENCFLKVLELPSVGYHQDQDIDSYAESCHGLGHIYTELGDKEQGVRYMKAARDLSPMYICCYAAIHSELKDYETALILIEQALTHTYYSSSTNEEGRHELFFYRGEAHSGLQMFAEADRDFKIFEEYNRSRGDTDAVAHAAIFQVKSLLKRSDLQKMSIEQIKKYRQNLINSPLSEYANIFIHQEYDHLLEIIEAYISIKETLEIDEIDVDKIDFAAQKLRGSIEKSEKLPFYFITDISDLKLNSSILDIRNKEDAQVLDVWLVVNREINNDLLVLLARFSEDKTIILYDNKKNQIPENLTESLIVIDDVNICIKMVEVTLLLDRSRRYIAEVKPIYAMAPIKTAPSFVSAQAGDVYPLPLED